MLPGRVGLDGVNDTVEWVGMWKCTDSDSGSVGSF